MLKLVIIFILDLFIISDIQCQIYLQCKFDYDDLPCRLVPLGGAPELDVDTITTISDPSVDPILPLSDVTSITTSTATGNRSHCKIPYQISGVPKDIYFCSKLSASPIASSCVTTDTTMQECVLGQYVSLQLEQKENQTYMIEVNGGTGPSCLSLYYYITRPNAGQIAIWCSDIVGSRIQPIGQVSNVPYNGWHRIEFSFTPQENNYVIHFNLQRFDDSEDMLFIALDEINIIDGRCESDVIETSTNRQQTMETSGQQIFTTTTSMIAELTTEESMLSSVQSSSILTSSTTTIAQTTQKTDTTSIVPTTTTAQQPFKPLFQCDFSTSCFANGQLEITDGSEFNPPDLGERTEPPQAPTSDVTSISVPTTNTEVCKLPYRPELNNGTSTADWDMWFCYNNQCPTPNGQTATCASGSYGLISLDPSELYKEIFESLNPNTLLRDSVGDQCLRFYYYFTVYDQQNWGQEIGVWVRPNNQTDNQFFLAIIKFHDMQNNSWNFREITFNSTFSNYTLYMVFLVPKENRIDDLAYKKTIYFALDNIELYDYNCSYVRDQLNPLTPTLMTTSSAQPTTATITATATASTTEGANPPTTTPKDDDLPLILGLSLGIGVPLVLIIIASIFYRIRVKALSRRKSPSDYDKYFPLENALNRTTKDDDAENDL